MSGDSEKSTNLCLRFGEGFVVNMLVDFKKKTYSKIEINGEEFQCQSCCLMMSEDPEDSGNEGVCGIKEESLTFGDYEIQDENIFPYNADTSQMDEPEEDWTTVTALPDVQEIILEPPEEFLLEDTFSDDEPVRITQIRKVAQQQTDHTNLIEHQILPQRRKSKSRSKMGTTSKIEIIAKKNLCSFEGCMYGSKNLSDVLKHEAIHTRSSQHECGECGKRFTQKCSLQRHVSSVHLHHKKIRCNICKTAFRDNYTLNRHRIHSHPDK